MRTLLIGILVLLALAVTTLLAAPGFIDWNARKTWIAGPLSDVLGGPVSIDGDVDLRLLPTPVFSAAGVRLSAPEPAAQDDHLTIEALNVRVALLPLLRGSIEVERLALVGPRLVLDVREHDALAWWPDGEAENWAAAVVPRHVTIEDGTVLLRDAASGNEVRLSDVDVRLSAESLVGPAEVEGDFVWRGNAISLDLSTRPPTATGAVPVTLSVGLDDTEAHLRYGGLIGRDGAAQGDLTLEGTSIAPFARLVLPEPEWPAAEQPFALRAGLRATPQRIELNILSLDVGGTSGRGAIAVDRGERATATVGLAFGRIALDQWLDAAAAGDALRRWWLGEAGRPALPDGLDLAVDLVAEAIDFRDEAIREARLQAATNEGHIAVSRLSARLPYGSDLALAGDVHMGDDPLPTVDVSGELSSSDLRALLQWLGAGVADVPSDRLRGFVGTASLIGTADDFQLTGIDVALDQTRLRGGLAYLDRGRPGVGLRLDVDRINLDHYLPIAGFADPGEAALLTALADVTERFDANIEARIGTMTASDVTAQGVHLDATVNNGSITLRDASLAAFDGASLRLVGTLGGLNPEADFDIAASIAAPSLASVLRGLDLPVPVSAEPFGAATVDGRLFGRLEDLTVELAGAAAGGDVTLAGRLLGLPDTPAYDLVARLSHPDAVALLDLLETGYRPRGPLGAVDLYARLRGTDEDYGFDDLQGTIGALSVAGQGRLRLHNDRPDITLDMRTSALTVDVFLPADGLPHRWRISPFSHWSQDPIDASGLTAFDGELALTATALTVGRYRFDNPALRLSLRDGILALPGMSGDLFGGAFGMSGDVRAGEALQVSGSLSLVDADLGEALTAVFDVEAADGVLNFSLAGDATGATESELIASVSGDGLVAVRDGVAHGLDLAAAAANLATLEQPLDVLQTLRPTLSAGATSFAALNAPFTVDAGIVRTEALRFAAPAGLAQGHGTLDLPRWQIDVTTDLTLADLPNAPPITVRWVGPVDAPSRQLQTQALAAYIAGRNARQDDASEPGGAPPEERSEGAPRSRQDPAPGRPPGLMP